MLQYIIWGVDPEIFRIGSWPVRWYGLLFAAGFLIGVQIMTHRFVWEFFKENQVAFEDAMSLNMGQLLSLPAILLGFMF